eukprot:XP_011678577.1 PREDICTED: transmembrane protein 130 isoform X1 [Strongylocentrotus purpuratus]
MFTKFHDRAWFLCLVIWLGPGDGDGHTAANVTGLESGEHASGRTGRHEESVGWSSFEQAKDKVAMLVEYREHVRDGILQDMKYTVSIKNDGPVILGSFATFVATVKANPSRSKDGKGNLMFTWTGPPSYLPQLMFGPGPCTIEIPFDMKLKPGEMTIQCTVHEVDVIGHSGELVGKSNSSIQVTDTINGNISLSSSAYPQCNMSNPSCSIPTKTKLTMEADLHDPSYFFEEAVLLYKWNMGNGMIIQSSLPELTYSYPKKGDYNITVNITAIKEERKMVGVWWRTIRVLDAITNLTIKSRSSSVQVGNKETVNVTCNGSPPVELCLTVDGPSSDWSNQTNTTCVMVLNDTCHTTINYYFQSLGEYTFQAAASNNVSFAVSVSTIHAHAPPALPAQSITAITVAVIAGLCMTSFALISFIQHVRKNRKRNVEVANFDFQFREHSDSFVKLKTSIFGWKRYISEKSLLKDNSSSNFYSL